MSLVNVVSEGTRQAALQLQQGASDRYDRIRSNAHLTSLGIRNGIARVYIDALDRLAALQEAETGRAADTSDVLLARAFGSPSTDPAAAMARRSADDRVAQLDVGDYREGAELLERAEMNKDSSMAAAIGFRAYTMCTGIFGGGAWSEVLDQYLASRPGAAQALAELGSTTQSLFSAGPMLMTFALPKPPEIAAFEDWQLRVFAAE